MENIAVTNSFLHRVFERLCTLCDKSKNLEKKTAPKLETEHKCSLKRPLQ